jgi:hypothetical protein
MCEIYRLTRPIDSRSGAERGGGEERVERREGPRGPNLTVNHLAISARCGAAPRRIADISEGTRG